MKNTELYILGQQMEMAENAAKILKSYFSHIQIFTDLNKLLNEIGDGNPDFILIGGAIPPPVRNKLKDFIKDSNIKIIEPAGPANILSATLEAIDK